MSDNTFIETTDRVTDIGPGTSIPPVPPPKEDINIVEIYKKMLTLWEQTSYDCVNSYKHGTTLQTDNPDLLYTDFLHRLHTVYFESIRNQITNSSISLADKQTKLLNISYIEKTLEKCVEILKAYNLTIDVNQLTAIFHGFINSQSQNTISRIKK